MSISTKKPVASGVANGLDTKATIQNYLPHNYSNDWALPPHPALKIMSDLYDSLNVEWTGTAFVCSDAAQRLDVPVGTKQTMVIELDTWIIPNHFSWGITANKHVDLYTAELSGSIERSLITELLSYGAIDVNLFQIEFGEILSPLLYSVNGSSQVAA